MKHVAGITVKIDFSPPKAPIVDEDLEYGTCKCGGVGQGDHNCPYSSDVHNDTSFECNCCNRCTKACGDDI